MSFTRIQIRRDTEADWITYDPVLEQGEMGYITDTGGLKIGDGSTVFTALPLFSSGGGGGGGGGADVELVTVLPATGTPGQLVYLTGMGQAYFWSGVQWEALGSANETGQIPTVDATLEPVFVPDEKGITVLESLQNQGWDVYVNTTSSNGSSSSSSMAAWWSNAWYANPSSYYTWSNLNTFTSASLASYPPSQISTYKVQRDDVNEGKIKSPSTSPIAYFNPTTTSPDADNVASIWASETGPMLDEDIVYMGFGGRAWGTVAPLWGGSSGSTDAYKDKYKANMMLTPPSCPIVDWEGTSWRMTLRYVSQGDFPGERYAFMRMGMMLDTTSKVFPQEYANQDNAAPESATMFLGIANMWQNNASQSTSTGSPLRAGVWNFEGKTNSWTVTGSKDNTGYAEGCIGEGSSMLFFGDTTGNAVASPNKSTWATGVSDPNPNMPSTFNNTSYFSAYWGETIFEWDHITGVLSIKERLGPNISVEGENGTPNAIVTTVNEPTRQGQVRAALRAVVGLPKFIYGTLPGYSATVTQEARNTGYHMAPIKVERLS